ncbi:hypothetical protein [Kitasatospora viridis]|uniref:hypothetical protein n=1 Tax=Kitasatospora viridis TaxID=281105 RepID=UPI001FE7DF5E|nr:hypothetical protein [Kitasatospora viridis]
MPAAVAITAMAMAMTEGALAANLSLTAVPFTLSSTTVAAPKGLGTVMTTVNAGSNPAAVSEVGLPKAGLDGVCIHATQSVNLPLVGTVGTWSLNITSPAAATPLTNRSARRRPGPAGQQPDPGRQRDHGRQRDPERQRHHAQHIARRPTAPTSRTAASPTVRPASSAWTRPAARPTSAA